MTRDDLESVEAAIAEHRVRLDRWLAQTYGSQQPLNYNGEVDCDYEYWGTIETMVGNLFDRRLTQHVSQVSLDSLMFFISRNEEVGCIIAWLSRGGPFSGVGDLTVSDFLYLCDASLSRPEDYSDYQLAACFHKVPELSRRHIDLVLRFFARDDAYTKRMAIDVLAAKQYDDIPSLAEQLWSHDDCEFSKLSCLYALKETDNGSSLFNRYLTQFKELFDIDASKHLPTHIKRLES